MYLGYRNNFNFYSQKSSFSLKQESFDLKSKGIEKILQDLGADSLIKSELIEDQENNEKSIDLMMQIIKEHKDRKFTEYSNKLNYSNNYYK